MTMKPMSTLSFNGEDAFEIKDSAAREALETLNTELDESKREISEQIGVLERLQPETAMVGHILEVDSVDETGKPLTYRAVENKPDIEVDDTLTQEGKAADAKATGEALKNISVDETLTFAEYQALSEEEKDSNKTFYIKDADIIDIKNVAKTCAKHIAFDNTNTTLTSKEVQGALVEVDNKLENFHDAIDGLSEQIDEQNEIAREFISDIYDETKTYTVDSYCINDNKLYKCTTETTGSFDGSCWKETNMTDELVTQATAISEQNKNKLDKSGGTITGASLGFNNGKGRILNDGTLTQLDALPTASNQSTGASILLSSDTSDLSNVLKVYNRGVKSYKIFGEHVMPSGSYTGNGSSATRTITICSAGDVGNRMLRIVGGGGRMALVGSNGAICLGTTTEVYGIDGINCKYENGILTINSTDLACNGNGYTYYYGVL